MVQKIIIAGQGGQGALRLGQIIAQAGMDEGKETTWIPSYGAEMRGGTTNCSVVLSDRTIASPIVSRPDFCIVMNTPSLRKFESWLVPGGTLIVNRSMVLEEAKREDIQVVYIPADDMAEEEGNSRGANMVLLGAYLAQSPWVGMDSVSRVIEKSFTGKKEIFLASNLNLLQKGYEMAMVCTGNQ